MDLQRDLARLALQEERLVFEQFDPTVAWTLGSRLKAAAEARRGAIAIDIQFMGFPLFYYAMPGTSPDNHDWLRRKRNVVCRFHTSSYAVARNLERRGTTLAERYGLEARDFAAAGGGFALRVRGTGVVGTVCVSGLPAREDHGLIVQVLAEMLGQDLAELALDAA